MQNSSHFTVGDLSVNGIIPTVVVGEVESGDDGEGEGGLGSRGIKDGRGSDGPDLRDGLIGGRSTRIPSAASVSKSGSGSDEEDDKKVEGEGEQERSPFRGHNDEARFVPGPEIDPGAESDTDGEGGPVDSVEILCELVYEPKETDLCRVLGFLIFRGSVGGRVDGNVVRDSKKLASSLVRPMRTLSRIVAIRGDEENRRGQRGVEWNDGKCG